MCLIVRLVVCVFGCVAVLLLDFQSGWHVVCLRWCVVFPVCCYIYIDMLH